jgi:Ni,Fe-hydrogenase III small subunit
MLKALRVFRAQGKQFVPDVRNATLPLFRGLPKIAEKPCESGCRACVDVCPSNAITLAPVRIDMGRCTFCDECVRVCPVEKLAFTTDYRIASTTRDGLVVGEGKNLSPVQIAEEIRRLFGRSLRLRSVSAGGCNGCELEINALANVNFDLQRYGIEFVASPRHSDGLVLSGPISRNMAQALELAYEGIPDPKFVIAVGACAISGGVFEPSPALDRRFLGRFEPKLYVPGCPPHPLTFACGILDVLGCKS